MTESLITNDPTTRETEEVMDYIPMKYKVKGGKVHSEGLVKSIKVRDTTECGLNFITPTADPVTCKHCLKAIEEGRK